MECSKVGFDGDLYVIAAVMVNTCELEQPFK